MARLSDPNGFFVTEQQKILTRFWVISKQNTAKLRKKGWRKTIHRLISPGNFR